jgi:hypothetical protein
MERKCRGGDERFCTAAAGTVVYGRLVEAGIQVVAEVVIVQEAPFAVGAVGVHVAVVFFELLAVVEILPIMRFRRSISSCQVVEGQKSRLGLLTSLHRRQTSWSFSAWSHNSLSSSKSHPHFSQKW